MEINTSSDVHPAPRRARSSPAITVGNSWVNIYGQTQGTQTAAYAGSGGYAGFATDLSTNALDMDGLLTIASNTAYMTGLPVPTFYLNTFGTAVGSNGLEQPRRRPHQRRPGRARSRSSTRSCFQIQQAALTGPTKIYLSSDQVPAFRSAFMVGSSDRRRRSIYFFPHGGGNSRWVGGSQLNGRWWRSTTTSSGCLAASSLT